MVRSEYHREGFECLGVLEGFKVAQPTEAAPGELAEVERGQGLGVE
jgi:hypothetical protein